MKKRVLITGGAGFIGSHLTEFLLDRDYAVIVMDNLITGKMENIAHLEGRDFEFREHDVTSHITVDGALDFILHL